MKNVIEQIRRAVVDKNSDEVMNIDKLLEKENIHEPVFEEYVPSGNKNEMYDPACAENVPVSEDWGYDSDSSVTYCEKEANFIEGRQLSNEWKSHIYAVIKDYQRQKFDELNLHTGEKVKQILSADKSGMAFGVKKSGMIRKKKGFYPVSHVCKVKEAEGARDARTSKKEKSTRHNPISRIIDAVKEPKTKYALLTEIASDDVTKVYTEKKKPNRKIFTMKNLLKFYGIEFNDDEICDSVRQKVPPSPTKIISAKTMSPEKCVFLRREECSEARYYPGKIQNSNNTPKHGGELVVEDIEESAEI
ncbi:uncharacterized protein LOC132734060 [Ruditapes philippinarum]|uniref:uncharacterized protein LOC132734060 n=1 Tax=Ruditapes philippinarum TaxID=129788 RepID=UPI00295AF5DE|nr:uncharacterized protein LOC132734060 [Ruditapes philippinarum]